VDVIQGVTGGALVLLLATVIGYLLNSNRQDRQQYRSEVKEFSAQITTLEAKHASKIDKMETRIDNLEREVDTERQARQQAEFRADQAEHHLRLLRPPAVGT
jgi:outer membrane murein-binding lipoprotein Lpp